MKVVMPQIGMTMQEGTIAKWLKADGEEIKKGEPMLLISTEKLENEIDSPADGILKITAKDGEIITCGELIAEIIEQQ